jgi:hypothetical protein
MTLFYLFAIAGIVYPFWLLAKKVPVRWYEWLLGVVGYFLGLFALQNWATSLLEVEPRAATFFLLAVGLPALIFLVISGLLPYLRLRNTA